MTVLTDIRRYPVKSFRGESLPHALVEPWGLAGDRRWLLVDPRGDQLTAREYPVLLRFVPRWTDNGGLAVTAPDGSELHVPVPAAAAVEARVFGTAVAAVPSSAAVNAWFTERVGVPCSLVYLADPTGRSVNPRFARPGDRVSFADAYPLLLTNTASLAAVSAWAGVDLSMIRFRPNLVVTGCDAWAEDGWRRVRIGDADLRAVKGCDRCVMTTIDPDTGAKGKEPLRTLAQYRRWDGKTWFGMNLIPDTPGVVMQVGDPVTVLEAVESPDGPPR